MHDTPSPQPVYVMSPNQPPPRKQRGCLWWIGALVVAMVAVIVFLVLAGACAAILVTSGGDAVDELESVPVTELSESRSATSTDSPDSSDGRPPWCEAWDDLLDAQRRHAELEEFIGTDGRWLPGTDTDDLNDRLMAVIDDRADAADRLWGDRATLPPDLNPVGQVIDTDPLIEESCAA